MSQRNPRYGSLTEDGVATECHPYKAQHDPIDQARDFVWNSMTAQTRERSIGSVTILLMLFATVKHLSKR